MKLITSENDLKGTAGGRPVFSGELERTVGSRPGQRDTACVHLLAF